MHVIEAKRLMCVERKRYNINPKTEKRNANKAKDQFLNSIVLRSNVILQLLSRDSCQCSMR